jgi:hypothetical protein
VLFSLSHTLSLFLAQTAQHHVMNTVRSSAQRLSSLCVPFYDEKP